MTVRVSKDAFTETVVAEFIGKKSKSLRISRDQQIQLIDEHQKNYVLKVCGTQEFLLERYPICQYKVWYIISFKLQVMSFIRFLISTSAIACQKEKSLNSASTHAAMFTQVYQKTRCIYRHTCEGPFPPLHRVLLFRYGNLIARFV